MNSNKLVLQNTVCACDDDGYDGSLTFRKDDEHHLHIEVEGMDEGVDSIRLTKLDVQKLHKWLAQPYTPKGKKIDEDDDSDLEDEEDESDIDEGGRRLRKTFKRLSTSPPVGDEVLVERLRIAHLLVTNFQVAGQSSDETKAIIETARKYLKAQLTLPESEDA